MKISDRILPHHQVFDIEGNISFDETAALESYIFTNIANDTKSVVINLENASYLTSSALGAFVRIHQTIRDKGISLSMMNSSKEIDNLFKITGMNRHFTFIQSESDLL